MKTNQTFNSYYLEMNITNTIKTNKSDSMIIRELLSVILQLIMKHYGFTDKEITDVLKNIYE